MGCATGETGSPSDVSESGATVGGRVVSDVGGAVEYWVRYGPTSAYGFESAHATVTVVRDVPHPVSGIALGGLSRSTTYHYRLCASDSRQTGGPRCGADRALTTQSFACGETVTTSVRFTGDVICDSEIDPGLVVGAAGIDINLAGHTLFGRSFSGGAGPTNVLNSGGHADVTIRNGTVFGATPIQLQGAIRNRILDVNATAAGFAVLIQGGEANEIRASDVGGRSGGVWATGSDRLTVTGTRAAGVFATALRIDSDLARVVRNRMTNEGSPSAGNSRIEVNGSGNRIVGNRLTGDGIVIEAGAGNVVAENEVAGALLGASPTLADSAGDGIFVGAFTAGTLLRNNIAYSNEGDGIEVDGTATRLRDNVAHSNGDFGIDAVAGVTDLGGNRASSNGNPLQCRNVLCE
jgi:parallel beta-helix repeat protein